MHKAQTNRREFLKTTGCGLAALSLGTALFSCAGKRSRPNIIFIMSDDHAAHAISCYGSKINQTPHLDRLAQEGMRFENCFCTNSICAPSRATILTGKYSHLNGVLDNRQSFDGSQPTFPRLLQQAGYQTAMVGKWHLKSDPTGFDYWNILPGQGDYYNPDLIEMGERKQYPGYATDIITDIALNWLTKRDSQKPFCLLYHHKAPHRNWMPCPKHLNLYDNEEIPEPSTLFHDHATKSQAAFEQEMTIEKHLMDGHDLKFMPETEQETEEVRMWLREIGRLTPEQRKAWDKAYSDENAAYKKANLEGEALTRWKYQRYIKDYLRVVASVDENVGRVLDFLDENDLTQNTMVIYCSDQGFFLGDHGWFDKRFMYEESLRMPLLIRYPEEITAGAVNSDIVLNLDFAPTFLDYAGISVPTEFQGVSIKPILQRRTPTDWRQAMYYHYYEFPGAHSVKKHYGIRTKTHKLIHFYDDIDAWELYDLFKDPAELNNVYSDSAYIEVVEQLKADMRALQEKYQDVEAIR
jgi:arylsulfatase A-like enzyme